MHGDRERRSSECKQSPSAIFRARLHAPTVSPFEQEAPPKQKVPDTANEGYKEYLDKEESLRDISLNQLRKKYVEEPPVRQDARKRAHHSSQAEVPVMSETSSKQIDRLIEERKRRRQQERLEDQLRFEKAFMMQEASTQGHI